MPTPNTTSTSLETVFEILKNTERRRLLILLSQQSQPVSIQQFTLENGTSDDTWIQLIHNHIPRMVDAGYIQWDEETQQVTKGPRFDEIKPVLELLIQNEDKLPATL